MHIFFYFRKFLFISWLINLAYLFFLCRRRLHFSSSYLKKCDSTCNSVNLTTARLQLTSLKFSSWTSITSGFFRKDMLPSGAEESHLNTRQRTQTNLFSQNPSHKYYLIEDPFKSRRFFQPLFRPIENARSWIVQKLNIPYTVTENRAAAAYYVAGL